MRMKGYICTLVGISLNEGEGVYVYSGGISVNVGENGRYLDNRHILK